MNKMFTTSGCYALPSIESGYQTGPSISKEEQIHRLESLRKVKGMSEKKQMELAKSK